ncbi:MAG: TIGR01777 family protein [Akkermansiaceae bacterium]|nr:TIGR01777 family protein [Akkermansiaceae bacterium]
MVIAGGSGFLGRLLVERLDPEGVESVVLTRSPGDHRGPGRAVAWDGRHPGDWMMELDGADALVNLTGKNVNDRPTRRHRGEVKASRVDSVRVLGEAIRRVGCPPRLWVQASSLAIHGDAGDRICDEATPLPSAAGYPVNVCLEWEAALGEALLPEMRAVVLRIGFVLGIEGGALPFLAKLARFGLGGTIGSGRQWISWIHRDDMANLFVEVFENPALAGVYHATGPEPATNREFMRELRRVLGAPWSPPAPAPAVWTGAWMLGSDPKIALTGRRCVPARLCDSGFAFRWPKLAPALENLYPQRKRNI